MNPARPAVTLPDRIARVVMTARTLGPVYAASYAKRNLGLSWRIDAAQAVQKAAGCAVAAQTMRHMGFSIDCALLALIGPEALERHLYRMECCA